MVECFDCALESFTCFIPCQHTRCLVTKYLKWCWTPRINWHIKTVINSNLSNLSLICNNVILVQGCPWEIRHEYNQADREKDWLYRPPNCDVMKTKITRNQPGAYQQPGPSGVKKTIWDHLGPSGTIWGNWNHVRTVGQVRTSQDQLGAARAIWGNIWRYMFLN